MTALALLGSSLTMTSREIAELTGKQHAHVMRDIRAMIEQLKHDPKLDWHCVSERYADTNGRNRDQYRLDRNTTINLVSGYDPVIRMRIINRWDELEHKSLALPEDYPAALRRLADESERRAQAERELEASRPKIAFHDQVVGRETLIDFTQAFSLLQRRTGQNFTRRTFLEFLRRHGIACQPNRHANIRADRFVPRKDYTGTWFVSELIGCGEAEWFMRPMAIAGIVALIEQDRLNPPLLPRPSAPAVSALGGAA